MEAEHILPSFLAGDIRDGRFGGPKNSYSTPLLVGDATFIVVLSGALRRFIFRCFATPMASSINRSISAPNSAFMNKEFVNKTVVPLQWDNLDSNFIVYPVGETRAGWKDAGAGSENDEVEPDGYKDADAEKRSKDADEED